MDTALFQKKILNYFKQHGRTLPWRKTHDPYSILVSEIMLQQTQVERVIIKYTNFLAIFPTLTELAHAPLKEVLVAWQGLGYNRRAKYLHQTAQLIENQYGGSVPSSIVKLCELPGIGYATACAIATYAWNKPHAFVETNIRTVFLYHFFPKISAISDTDIAQLVKKTLYVKNPRMWYWALMDYGSMLKKEKKRNNLQSKHYVKQSPFIGSNRQLRGAIVALLVNEQKIPLDNLHSFFHEDKNRVNSIVRKLTKEGLLVLKNKHILLP
ncbi:MAG: A/G-specific adenine glycosylase [Candidatus Roizmanbacteria bacterium]|nr:A/G-specific adenine glycosylase [Candidatus Roizmanbacteria bacterium]